MHVLALLTLYIFAIEQKQYQIYLSGPKSAPTESAEDVVQYDTYEVLPLVSKAFSADML